MVDAERKLWRAVLGQAYQDAEMVLIADETAAEPLEASLARRYLRADSPFGAAELALVCGFADLPADRVFLWARHRYPQEQIIESHLECGGSPPLFVPQRLPPLLSSSAAGKAGASLPHSTSCRIAESSGAGLIP